MNLCILTFDSSETIQNSTDICHWNFIHFIYLSVVCEIWMLGKWVMWLSVLVFLFTVLCLRKSNKNLNDRFLFNLTFNDFSYIDSVLKGGKRKTFCSLCLVHRFYHFLYIEAVLKLTSVRIKHDCYVFMRLVK